MKLILKKFIFYIYIFTFQRIIKSFLKIFMVLNHNIMNLRFQNNKVNEKKMLKYLSLN
jgi:glycerol-3-phosphate responsive antiterminator